jgi:hypothetical protein
MPCVLYDTFSLYISVSFVVSHGCGYRTETIVLSYIDYKIVLVKLLQTELESNAFIQLATI